MAVETHIEYVVYYVQHERKESADVSKLKLVRVELPGYIGNSFNSEQEAIDAMIEHQKTYMDFVILKQYRVTNFKSL